ncbi:hypothetical protein GCM10025868_13080 [Angustibacter aerolatus]|uniref:Oligopeptide transport permease C-like N-terminal domain-containing protein n=1 Tax=Angustibacter aerolatus TaxID=1162965 RepID=A0ABQ6JF60_9ACTN|nr:hypothetical protein [Angustibacter aerolatus]GMA86058.1 hypothetical protein GCM10025868_13080 [Angustibacter aerolatus]
MTIAAAGAEQESHAAEGVTGVTAVAGRSPAQIAFSRLRRDRVGTISAIVVVLVVVIAVCAPLITHLVGVTPNDTNTNLIGDGALPKFGPLHSGITGDHPLGIEPGTGRDTLARLLYGARISLMVALLGTVLTTILGVFFGILAGYGRGRLDAGLGYLMDLILAFPRSSCWWR